MRGGCLWFEGEMMVGFSDFNKLLRFLGILDSTSALDYLLCQVGEGR